MMNKKILRVALAQINTTVGDLSGNTEKIVEYIHKAENKGCDIVTFPELSVTGYPPEDLLLKPKFIADNIACLKKIAKETKDIVAVVGFVDKQKQALYNSAALIYKNKIWGVYHKMSLPNYGVFDEKRYFAAGKQCLIYRMDGIYSGINICEDIWEQETVNRMSKQGIRLIFNISSSPFHTGKMGLRKRTLLKYAKSHNLIIFYNNLVGGQDELVFDGRSLAIIAKKGIVALGKAFAEDLLIRDLDVSGLKAKIKKFASDVRLIRLPKEIKTKSLDFPLNPVAKEISLIEEVYLALILGLQDYLKKNNFKKVVIGLSGGIDSALTAAIATVALGKENVICVFMPSKFSSSESKNYSRQLADNLGISLKEIPIQNIFDSFKDILKDIFRNLSEDITEENLQARIRGTILMALSNKFAWLVVTTGNKSEMSTGYATLYGDMAGGFALIKDVPKTLVLELARFFNAKEGKEVIPEVIIKREPTAELRPNQKDSDSLPAYGILDEIIKFYVENNYSYEEIVKRGLNRDTVKKVIDLIDKAEYKRRQSPPGIKITPRAFGKDRRMPITNCYLVDKICDNLR